MSPTRRAWQAPELRTDEEFDRHRPVGWLELFFDLVFVVIIARLAHHLEGHPDLPTLVGFVVEFLAVFWAWNGFTYYTERFESEGLEFRLLIFLSMIPVVGLAVFADEGMGHTYAGFAGSYLLARLVNQISWVRAGGHVPLFRPVMVFFLGGFLAGAALVVAGFFVEPPLRTGLFTAGVLVEIITPYLAARQQARLPRLSTSKFPERFGLLTMIVLGESVTGVVVGMSELSEHGELHTSGIVLGVLGLGLGFGLWWLYYDFVGRRPARPTFVATLVWVYLHLAVLVAIVLVGAGVSVTIAGSAADGLTVPARLLLAGGTALGLASMAVLQLILLRAPDEPTHRWFSPGLQFGVAVVLAVLGAADLGWSPLGLLLVLMGGLLIPMTYGAYVWYSQELEPAAG